MYKGKLLMEISEARHGVGVQGIYCHIGYKTFSILICCYIFFAYWQVYGTLSRM